MNTYPGIPSGHVGDATIGALRSCWLFGFADEFALAIELGCDDVGDALEALLEAERNGWLRRRPNRFHDAPIGTYALRQVEWALTDDGEAAHDWLGGLSRSPGRARG